MIAGNLEYVIGSLPHLSFKDTDEERSKVVSLLQKYAGPSETGKGIVAILDGEAGKFLSSGSHRIFQQINLATIHSETFQKSRNSILATFSSYVFALKKGVQQLRTARKNGADPSITKKLPVSLGPGTPLEEEIQLLKLQWDQLEELSMGHYTDFSALCIYKLKLLLLLRWWSFDEKQGYANFLNSTKKTEDGR